MKNAPAFQQSGPVTPEANGKAARLCNPWFGPHQFVNGTLEHSFQGSSCLGWFLAADDYLKLRPIAVLQSLTSARISTVTKMDLSILLKWVD